MDSQRCTGRTTRLILRALLELLELPGAWRELVFVTTPGMRREVFDRAASALRAIIPGMQVEMTGDCRVWLKMSANRHPAIDLCVVTAGDDLRGRCPGVLCIDHYAEELLDALPATQGWGRLPMTNSRVVVRHPGVTHGPAIDPVTTTA